jgi:hypothetical protein
MCAGNVSAREEADRLQVAWIRRIENRYSVAEHVADIQMPAVEHDLNAVRPSAKIAVGQMTETFPDALRRNCTLLRGARLSGTIRQRCETKQTFHAIASSDIRHVFAPFSNTMKTSLHVFVTVT